MWGAIASFQRDERGGFAVLAALFMTVLMGFAALAVDVGKAFVDRRKAQSAADLAAMAAVGDLLNASKAASATVQRNNIPVSAPVAVELGIYTADMSVAPAGRFKQSSAANANAARVTVQTVTPLMFGRVLNGENSLKIKTQAVATQSAFASFAIGSRLASVDNGILNQTLGGMLGTNLSLSVMDYNALADAKLDLFDYSNALATRARITGPTYESVVNANLRTKTVYGGLSDAADTPNVSSAAKSALSSLASATYGAQNKIGVAPLISLGPYQTMSSGQKPKFGVSASALDLASVAAQLANAQHQAEFGLNLNIPGIAGATVKLAVGERPQGASWMGVGSPAASAHTAQTRLLLTVNLAGAAPVASIQVPIYVEVASATAVLSTATCGFPNVATSRATLNVTPGVVDAWIGNVSDADFTNFKSAPTPPAAALVSTPLLKVTARAHAAMTNLSATPVNFSYSEIVQQTKKTVSTQDYTSSLTSLLLRDLDLQASILGLGIGTPGIVSAQVSSILSNAVSPIDQILSRTLAALGVGIGQADVWMLGLRCDGAVLVN